ncbi:TonB-dependent receptor [Paraflavitalea sp. CAU 1676]|uniref:TonB-dependent receptor domain-containing protein n=1 Tax=Paraflavitalea sp. CAU 1676 TaxID=3032598 RepID=UPI0023DBC160|nr:TonB-dependent receptor [Paraflavitalea sp. CAU 1676]MDF2187242.1 TonB-dependent receptor [Paraflavitalea sp. CAU 1676]
MSKKYALLVVFIFVAFVSFAQSGKIAGKVLNSKNEPLQGVSIKIAGAPGGTTTDVEGRFSLTLSTGKKYELNFTAVGYAAKVVNDVEVTAGQVNELSIIMERGGAELGAVTVTSRRTAARLESVNAVIAFQKNTGTVASVVSAETIRRSPDRNTGDVLKRTPGASLQEGKFLVVRGLADRYNQAMLNGILLTSTEPDRKTFSFDLIPAPMIDNIVINKAFLPEYPGEWAGGLIQVNTKDIPSQSFLNVQVGTGFNTQTIGKDFYKAKGGKWDWLGIDDGTRGLPPGYTTKSDFDILTPAEKTALGKQMANNWTATSNNAPLDVSFQANGGFVSKLFKKTVGGTFGVTYNKRNRYIDMLNQRNSILGSSVSKNYSYDDDRFTQDVLAGALASLSMQINPRNKVSVKSIINVNSTNYFTNRSGLDFDRGNDVRASEITFKQNTFFTTQLSGEHTLVAPLRLKWYGAFNILDGYIPDQRRIVYARNTGTNNPYGMLVANSLSQESGSRIFQNLSDYIYTAGGDLTYNFDLFGQRQTVKGGYMLQIKDRLYDAKLFANYLPRDNASLRLLPADKIFAPENFGDGAPNSTLFAFDAIKGNSFRYLANTILNAGFIQFDNQLSDKFRVVWGVRVENYDQLVGSVKKYDPRHTHSEVLDWLPGLNATYKLNDKTNLRLSGSQTVIRPELRELSFLNLYDFELNASVQGNPDLQRTKATNFDLRYELYPRAGEAITFGVFYKNFDKAIEQIYNEGSGGASTFNFQNTDKAENYGVELEFRKRLDFITSLKNFTLTANAAYIKSRVQADIQGVKIDRQMQGQSPYLLNLGLNYDLQKHGFNATLLFNQIGERIYLVGDISAGAGSPDIYEAPRAVLDFQMAKKLLKNKGEIRLNVTDILNRTQYFYQNAESKDTFQKNKDPYRFTRTFGTSIGVTFNYSIL